MTRIIVVPDFEWKKIKRTKAHPNTKLLPIYNDRNNKEIFIRDVSFLVYWKLLLRN